MHFGVPRFIHVEKETAEDRELGREKQVRSIPAATT